MTDFPSALFAPVLRQYSEELAARYWCPAKLPLAACLTVAGAAIGNGASVLTGLGSEPCSPNLYMAIGAEPSSLANQILGHVLQPLRDIQADLFRKHACNSEEAIAKEAASVERERAEFLKGEKFPDPAHLAVYDNQLATLRSVSRPVILLEDPDPADLIRALPKSLDNSLLCLFSHRTTLQLIEMADQSKSDWTLELVRNGWDQRTAMSAYLDGYFDTPSITPSLSLLCQGEPRMLVDLLTNPDLVKAGIAQLFLAFDPGLRPTILTICAFKPLQHQAAWDKLIKSLFAMRHASSPLVYRLSDDAKAFIYTFYNELVRNAGALPLDEGHNIEFQVMQSAKLALIDHLCRGGCGTGMIGSRSAKVAVAVTRQFIERRRDLLDKFSQEQRRSAEAAACNVMLDKLKAKAPLKPRNLFRTYDRQGGDIHQPILDRLIAAGKVVLKDGLLRLPTSDEGGTQPGGEPGNSSLTTLQTQTTLTK